MEAEIFRQAEIKNLMQKKAEERGMSDQVQKLIG